MVMHLFRILIKFLPFIVFATILGLLIYFIVKRINDKQKETFEDRDN